MLSKMIFRRKFSANLYKQLRLPLAQMTFTSDFIHADRGDLYPMLEKQGDVTEEVSGSAYYVRGTGRLLRLLGQHFPYATYEVAAQGGSFGIRITSPEAFAQITTDGSSIFFTCGEETVSVASDASALVITCRGSFFDVYTRKEHLERVATFHASGFENICREAVFTQTTAALVAEGNVTVLRAESCMDCGIAQADIRAIRYENGDVMLENGKVYLTASVRMEAYQYQGIFAWTPGTCDLQLTGALFYDAGDSIWGNDVAASVKFNRKTGKWNLWVCSFSHEHILGCAAFDGDVRFGLNVVDIRLMEPMAAADSDTAFRGRSGDEDPDFIFNEQTGKWNMVICRVVEQNGKRDYRYCLFESDDPFAGYVFKDMTAGTQVTGGSLMKLGGKIALVCGSRFDRRAEYHVYDTADMSRYDILKCDYDDGGFRGWGTVMELTLGTRKRYFWLTFDRCKASPDYTWSYGNIYCFEGYFQ